VLASFNSQCRATLDEICKLMGMSGKPDGLCGSDVETHFRDGRIQEIADYCENDVVNTYRLWLRHELFRGGLDQSNYEESELRLRAFLDARNARPAPPSISSNEAVGGANGSSQGELSLG
jgi:3'-5' exonuclease